MSKRFGNVINPDDIVDTYGADALRVYEMFMGPFTDAIAWNTNSLVGARRFLERVWRVQDKVVIIDKAELLDDLRVTVPLGQVLPLASGAMGRSLLSRLRESAVERILKAEIVRGQRGREQAVLGRLRRDLEKARRRGYAESLGEIQAGINSVASPIFDHQGHAVLTIGVIGLGSALPPRSLPRCGRKVREVASLITRAMGGTQPTWPFST